MMTRVRLLLTSMAIYSLLVVAGCGTVELIETPAGEMNLVAADLGTGWSQMGEDMGLADWPAAGSAQAEEFSMRRFNLGVGVEVVASLVWRFEDVESAQREMASGAVGQVADDMVGALVPGGERVEFDVPDIGDEALMEGGTHFDADLELYVITFRKANVIGMLMVTGDASSIDETRAIEFARAMEARVN